MTNLSKALSAFFAEKEVSASAFSKTIGVAQSTISRLVAGDRPAVDTLIAMKERWHDDRATLGLLVAHLRDEIERAGRSQAEIEVTVNRLADDDIHLLADCAREDADLAAIIHDLAQLARRMRDGTRAGLVRYPVAEDAGERDAAAEPPPAPYAPKAPTKGKTRKA